MTKQERQSNGIAKRLVKALGDIENYDGDPADVMSDAEIFAVRQNQEVKDAVSHLSRFYSSETA